MAAKGGQPGNNNAGKAKDWESALRYVANNNSFGRIKKAQALRAIAEKVFQQALDGDMQAIKEIGDRLDGKPKQAIEGQVDSSLTIEVLRFADLDPE